jgi:transposase
MERVFQHKIGIDIAAATFTLQLYLNQPMQAIETSQTFDNQESGFETAHTWLTTKGVNPETAHIIMEATGVYWQGCALFFHSRGYGVSVINPAQGKAFARTTMRRAKTDSLDADLLARFGIIMKPRLWTPPTEELSHLQQLSRQREAYLDMRTEEKNRLHALKARAGGCPEALAISQKMIELLTEQLAQIEAAIQAKIAQSPALKESQEILESICGIGAVTASILISETNNFADFENHKQLTAYAGLAPVPFQSGTSVHRKEHISKIGNAKLRKALYMAAISAARYNPILKIFYQRLREQGKPAKVALVAVARKLLRISLALIQKRQKFDANFVSKKPNI